MKTLYQYHRDQLAKGGVGSGVHGHTTDKENDTEPLRRNAKFGDEVVVSVNGVSVRGTIAGLGEGGKIRVSSGNQDYLVDKTEMRMPKGGYRSREKMVKGGEGSGVRGHMGDKSKGLNFKNTKKWSNAFRAGIKRVGSLFDVRNDPPAGMTEDQYRRQLHYI